MFSQGCYDKTNLIDYIFIAGLSEENINKINLETRYYPIELLGIYPDSEKDEFNIASLNVYIINKNFSICSKKELK